MKNFIFSRSRLGLILVGIYVLSSLYLIIEGLACNTGFFGCGRVLFLLTIPAYLPLAVMFTGTSLILYLFSLMIASVVYTGALYEVGYWIEKQKPKLLMRNTWFKFKKITARG